MSRNLKAKTIPQKFTICYKRKRFGVQLNCQFITQSSVEKKFSPDVFCHSFFPSSTRLRNSLAHKTVAASDLTVYKVAVKALRP
jgi:hypothetical protein